MGTAGSGETVDAIEEAEAAKDELQDALREAGVLLPSLGLDTVTYGCDHLPPLVDLGRCNAHTARKLAQVLRGATP